MSASGRTRAYLNGRLATAGQLSALAKGLGTRVIQSLASSFGVTPDWSANGSGMHLRIDAAA